MNTDEVLAAIDNALHDDEVSCDAMRWTPEPAPEPTAPLLQVRAPLNPNAPIVLPPPSEPLLDITWTFEPSPDPIMRAGDVVTVTYDGAEITRHRIVRVEDDGTIHTTPAIRRLP